MNDDATNTKEDKNPAEIVRDKWNDTLKERVEMPAIKMSWQNATVQNHIRQEHLNGHSVTSYLVDFLGGRKLKRGLEVGGGLGHQAIAFYKNLDIEQFDVLDISTYAVDEGNARASREGYRMQYGVADLNNDPLPKDTYDLIIASGALHHIENLEHLFSEIASSLTPEGIFFANDYMGPNQMQWTDTQLGLMNAISALLPDKLSQVLHRNNMVYRPIKRIPLEIFAKHDPSEGVRSADIFDVMAQYLEIVEIVPFGQTIVYELLRGRVHNFDESDEKDRAILGLICLLEKTLLNHDVISSDFNLVIAQQKPL